MFGFFSNRIKTARQIEESLLALQSWSRTAWLAHWERGSGASLQAELDAFLPDAMAHARRDVHLESAYSAMITRAILLGIARSYSHEISEFEGALGVTMPVEATT